MASHSSLSNTLSPGSIRRPLNLIFLSFLLLIVAVTVLQDVTVFLPVVLVGVAFISWSYRNPEWWLFSTILLHAIFLQRTQEISAWELFYGLYFFGFLGYWFVDRILIRGKSFITEQADAWLFSFLVVCLLSFLVALLENAVMFLWVREFLAVSTLFLFFPAREILKTDRGLKIAMAALLILTAGLASYNIMMYGSTTLAQEYYGELIGRRQPASVHFFFAMVVLAASVWIHGLGNRNYRALTIFTLIISTVALIATFTRGFWVGTAISLLLLFFLAEPRKKFAIAIGSTIMLCLGTGGLLIFWGDVGGAVLSSVVSRFLSVGEALKDISFTNRIAESLAVVDAIINSPILGHGFGSSFRYHDFFKQSTYETWYSHNGYLFLLFKVGLIGVAAFIGFYGIIVTRGYRLARSVPAGDWRCPFVHGTWAILVSMMVVTLTSNVFIEKEPLLLISLGAAFLANVHEEQ